jgi:hypothetical protein
MLHGTGRLTLLAARTPQRINRHYFAGHIHRSFSQYDEYFNRPTNVILGSAITSVYPFIITNNLTKNYNKNSRYPALCQEKIVANKNISNKCSK